MPVTADPPPPPMPVWWVAPNGDRFQHGTSTRPPLGGGRALTLCEVQADLPTFVDALPIVRPFCPACLQCYLNAATVEPLWWY